MNKYETLKYYFGYDKFRPMQEDIIDTILNKENVMCILATGGGKSLCFQVPGLMMEGLTIVITPLISLMCDQVKHLKEKGISAMYLNSTQRYSEQLEVLKCVRNNKIKFLYVAPEKFNNRMFIDAINDCVVSQITLDEAHCISVYGHDFRVDYANISKFLGFLSKRPVVSAFTATASQSVINDIKECCNVDFKIFKSTFDRPNLYYETIQSNDEIKDLKLLLDKYSDEQVLVYCLTRRQTESLYYRLDKESYSLALYHGGLDSQTKSYYQDLFLSKKKKIMIATSSFGMGIDGVIRVVINMGFPMSLEDLSQQQGRAGRDNKESYCYMIYNMKDLYYNEYFINAVDDLALDKDTKKLVKKVKREKLREVIGYAQTKRCLHEYLVSHFGELYMSYCCKCSNCNRNTKTIDYIKEARLVVDTLKLTKEKYGTNIVSKIIVGSKENSIKEKYLNKIKTYNKSYHSINEIKNVISNMVSDG
nr:RecQ family ATP-dependent DNA helicase [Acholeplasmatales bacterium]